MIDFYKQIDEVNGGEYQGEYQGEYNQLYLTKVELRAKNRATPTQTVFEFTCVLKPYREEVHALLSKYAKTIVDRYFPDALNPSVVVEVPMSIGTFLDAPQIQHLRGPVELP